MRAVTSEVLTAAQKLTGNKAQIVVRPQMQAAKPGSSAGPVDDIFISLPSPSQAVPLEEKLTAIARNHGLSEVSRQASPGVSRFDFALNGSRTHTIHIVSPVPSPALASERKGSSHAASGRLAIIIDDVGYDRAAADAVIALPFPLTISVLPHLAISSDVAEEAHSRGDQVLLHLPMQSEVNGVKQEDIELRVGMSQAQVASAVSGMLDTVPNAVGVNNHQGSLATADPQLMQALMPLLRERGLFFIDSRTDAKTLAFDIAKRDGVPAASRKVFLDDTDTRKAIVAQIELAARDAMRDGSTIAIGHPRPATIAALAEEVPRLESRGVHLVFASDLVN
jgi:polysaccharide deacetylase 2 family uncharacterized protein YibQ